MDFYKVNLFRPCMLSLFHCSPCAKTKTMLFFAWVLASLAPAFALNPAYHPSNKCSQSEAVRMSIALVHRWSTLVNNGDPDFIIKNFLAEDALQYFVPDEEQCTYQPISLSVSLIQQFTEAIRMELIIKNVKWYEWQAGTRSNDSSDHSSGYYRKPRADVRDGDVVISAVGFISADGINPSLFNVLFYLRASCGCNYQVYRQVVTPYNCLSKIAGNVCES